MRRGECLISVNLLYARCTRHFSATGYAHLTIRITTPGPIAMPPLVECATCGAIAGREAVITAHQPINSVISLERII